MANNALPLIPDWREDETLYSLCARMHRMRGFGNPRETGIVLFGTPHAYKDWGAPTQIHHFCEVTGQQLGDARTILLERTVLAAYYPFLRKEQRQLFDQRSRGTERTAWLTRFGMSASAFASAALRCCPSCVEQDLDSRGVACWRLPHQMPGAWWCREHHRLLHEHRNQQAAWLEPSPRSEFPAHEFNDLQTNALHIMAVLSQSLIGMASVDLPMMKRAVLSTLRDQGVVTNGKPISARSLGEWFLASSISQALPYVDSGLDRLADGSWIYETFLSRRASHPLLWMLLWSAAFVHLPLAEIIHGFHHPQKLLSWDENGQGMLWIESDIRADARVREIILTSTSVQDAASQLQVSTTAIRRYMRRAQCSPRGIREQARRDARKSEAMNEVEQFIRTTPRVTRSNIHLYCKSAVSWLRRWEPELLDSLLVRVPEVRGRQLEIFSDCTQ